VKAAYWLYRLAGVIVPKIPAGWGYTLCRLGAGVVYRLNNAGCRNVRQNLRRVMGPQTTEAEINQLARQTFNHIFYNYFDLFRLPALDDEAVNRLVTVTGWENVEAAMTGGQGILMTSAHLGNIEVPLYAMLLRGVGITIPVERVSPPELFDYLCQLRMSKGLNLIPIDGSLLALIRALKRGQVAGVAADRDITHTGQIVNFFCGPARLPDGHLRLALKTGAPVVVGFSHRNPDHTYQVYFLPAWSLPEVGSTDARLQAGMAYIVAEMEKAIRRHPEQWTVTVPIWSD
jgi:lauroyl/myristoyl acyltransferase